MAEATSFATAPTRRSRRKPRSRRSRLKWVESRPELCCAKARGASCRAPSVPRTVLFLISERSFAVDFEKRWICPFRTCPSLPGVRGWSAAVDLIAFSALRSVFASSTKASESHCLTARRRFPADLRFGASVRTNGANGARPICGDARSQLPLRSDHHLRRRWVYGLRHRDDLVAVAERRRGRGNWWFVYCQTRQGYRAYLIDAHIRPILLARAVFRNATHPPQSAGQDMRS